MAKGPASAVVKSSTVMSSSGVFFMVEIIRMIRFDAGTGGPWLTLADKCQMWDDRIPTVSNSIKNHLFDRLRLLAERNETEHIVKDKGSKSG